MTLDIIYLCDTEKWWDWEAHGFAGRAACIAQALADHPDVREMLVVNVPSSIWRAATMRLRGETARAGLTTVRKGLHVFDQISPLPRERGNPLLLEFGHRLRGESIRRDILQACESLSLRDPVVWLTGPYVARYLEWFPGSVVAYDARDEWLADPAVAPMRQIIRDAYDVILRDADVVFAVSEPLVHAFEAEVPVARHIPNAVDVRLYEMTMKEPSKLSGIPHPRVGYLGMMQDRVDVGLIGELAMRMPGVQFVFVGPVLDEPHFTPLAKYPNVQFVGACQAREVPAYLTSFDVCMMPHVQSEFTRNMDPLKLYEYIAAGRLVVSSDLPGLKQPSALVRRARGVEEFASALEDAIEGRWTMDPESRESYLTNETWECRVDEIVEVLSEATRAPNRRSTT